MLLEHAYVGCGCALSQMSISKLNNIDFFQQPVESVTSVSEYRLQCLCFDKRRSPNYQEKRQHQITMAYVTRDGALVERTPFSLNKWLRAVLRFFCLLIQTLIDPNYSKHGNKYVRDYRPPGDGPPKPPTRKYGGFGPSGSAPPPPPMGGCGCGG
ncbi:uncharacterized protein [Epargyreus clarus]|uniref:uncharacterized protein n=1 Tax=Epargyreus clarus TaxID=520877 RepID=UPI003C2F8B87